ncbi:hypothetical protein L5F37_03840 [Aliarcobacter butzleri]|uniref:hypothetical protein n=1 Tax=Aliarcobacter butzleri TaxID=28197 RepID=UPI001EDAE346|nr:hypothetical protein [Aliarcobacter butzleri]MCG3662526.1 hypothetical protein [Aliarcobacter butzleri]
MSDLAKLKEEATALNIQFPSNITYEKLLQRIEAVKALQKAKEEENNPNDGEQNNHDGIDKSAGPGGNNENNPNDILDNSIVSAQQKIQEAFAIPKELLGTDGEQNNSNTHTIQTQNNQSEEQEQEDTLIKRVSKCGNYRVKIKGLEETARRSGVTIEDLKSVLGTGKLLNNFTFEIA